MFGGGQPGSQAVYAFIEPGIGAGNLLGGFLIGLIGMRFAKGQMVIAGYTFFGLAITFLALTGNLGLAIGFAFGSGIANMLFVIPSQTLFQERTPPELMGRVVGFRFALVFGAMTLAMASGACWPRWSARPWSWRCSAWSRWHGAGRPARAGGPRRVRWSRLAARFRSEERRTGSPTGYTGARASGAAAGRRPQRLE